MKDIAGLWKDASRGLLVRLHWGYPISNENRGVLYVIEGEMPAIDTIMLAPVMPTRVCDSITLHDLHKQNGYYTFTHVTEYFREPGVNNFMTQEMGLPYYKVDKCRT